jgi:hypothetical protein
MINPHKFGRSPFPASASGWMLVAYAGRGDRDDYHLLSNLVSYWTMDEANTFLDRGEQVSPLLTPTQRNDSHGTNHLSDPTNCLSVSGANAKINNSVYFGGSNRLTHVSNTSLQVTSDFTFSLWANLTGGGPILWKGEGATSIDYSLIVDGTYGLAFMGYIPAVGLNGTVGAYAPLLSSGVWYHIVAWYDSSDGKVRIRINDTTTYTSAAAVTLVQTTNDFIMGILQYGGGPAGAGITGVVDEVGFWKRLLTAEEITELYNGGAGLPFSSFTA